MHALAWYLDVENLDWFKGLPNSQQREAITNHIREVINHYKGYDNIIAWDVVNEALADQCADGTVFPRNSYLQSVFPDFIDVAFRTAREVSPNIKMFYNDYNTQIAGWAQAKNQLNLIRGLLARGVPINGVGFQMHIDDLYQPNLSVDEIRSNLKQYTDLGLEVQITELDINCPSPCNGQKQAEIYKNFLEACVTLPGCTAFVIWGIFDHISYQSQQNRHLFTQDNQPKPAYDTMVGYLKGLQGIEPRKHNY